jgi:transcriptional regulator with XRE-family HTH domain
VTQFLKGGELEFPDQPRPGVAAHRPPPGAQLRDILAANFRAARARAKPKLGQELVAARMRALGYREWRYQTVGAVEKGKRRLTAEKIRALARVLETSVVALISPTGEDGEVRHPSGDHVSARSDALLVLGYNDRSVTWDGTQPIFTPDKGEVTAQVVIRPRWLAGPSPVDPAFGDPAARAPMP